MAEIVLDDVWKVYPDGTEAVRDLDLNIHDGEFMVLVGPSGCGKTTALRMVAGLEAISKGTVRIGDKVVNDVPPKDRDIAMVFQSYALYPHMTVYDNMGFGLKLQKVPKQEIDKRVRDAAGILGLEDFLKRKPKALSGGQRQRVAMGRAIVRHPQAFLMDEPLSNLDAKLRVELRADIARLQRELATTTIYVTHDQVEAMTMGDRVAVMNLGRLQQVDVPQRLYDQPANLFVAGFIGTPPMNLLEAQVHSQNGDVTLAVGNQILRLSDATLSRYPGVQRSTGKDVVLGIRSDDLRPAATNPDLPKLTGRLSLVEALGSQSIAYFYVEAHALKTHTPEGEPEEEEVGEGVTSTRPNLVASMSARDAMDLKLDDEIPIAVDVGNVHVFDADSGAPLR